MNDRNITILVDNDSWILPYAENLLFLLSNAGYDVLLARDVESVKEGWVNFILGCERLVSKEILSRNKHNLVVHESDLPSGRGFAPMTWQILEGKSSIPVCLLEADIFADSGDIWLRDVIQLDGSELCYEWRSLQGKKTVEMCMKFVDDYKILVSTKQIGSPSYYKRRTSVDSQLDFNKSLREQFSNLQVVGDERYPAYFEVDGCRYIMYIYKSKTQGVE